MEIKLEYLRRYLSARGMNLVIFFDYDYRSEYTYSELGISPVTNELTKDKEDNTGQHYFRNKVRRNAYE